MIPVVAPKSALLTQRALSFLGANCQSGSVDELNTLFARVRATDPAVYPLLMDVSGSGATCGVGGYGEYFPHFVAFDGAFVFTAYSTQCATPSALAHRRYGAGRGCDHCVGPSSLGPLCKVLPADELWIHDRCLPGFLVAVCQRLCAETFWMGQLDGGSAVARLPREVVNLICAAM